MALRYSLDTNVLIRLARSVEPEHNLVSGAVHGLTQQGIELCYTPQNIGEFWNVGTRPKERNGFGLSILKMAQEIAAIEQKFTLLAENARVYETWVRLLKAHDVRGVQVHDAHLAATLEVHNVRYLLTFNGRDFARYGSLIAVHPTDI